MDINMKRFPFPFSNLTNAIIIIYQYVVRLVVHWKYHSAFSTSTSWHLPWLLLEENTSIFEVFKIKSQVVCLSDNDLNTKMHAKELSISFARSV